MYIEKTKWEKLMESFKQLYTDYEHFKNSTKKILNDIDFCMNEIEQNKTDKIYVITNNSIVNDEISYNIFGVTTKLNEAKEMLKQNINYIKYDTDFDNLNAVKITEDINPHALDEVWVYDENEYEFNLYLNCNYNSNNFSSRIEKYDLDKLKKRDMEFEL